MIALTPRCAALRDEVVNKKSYVHLYWGQREVLNVLGTADCEGMNLSNEELIAAGVCNVIEKFTPIILPGELIVGVNYSDGKILDWYCPKDTETDRKGLLENGFTSAEIDRYFAVRDKISGLFEHLELAPYTTEETQSEEEWAAIGRGIDSNHTVIGYEEILKNGFSGMLRKVEEFEQKNGSNGMYRGMKKLCISACKLGERYAEEAQRLLDKKDSAYSEDDLHTIIATCSKIPSQPASTLLEAAQSLWFAHIINCWEDWINANSLGHLDQILYPYYRADIDSGRLTKEQAFEIICLLWIKLYRDYDVQQSCVGGRNAKGESMVNELSYMMLDATEALDFIRCLSVRFDSHTDKAFLRRALEVVGHVQKGVPFFFNDDVMIPALISKGIPLEDACDYTEIGCVETVIPGKSNPHAVTGEINALKAIEYVLNNGTSMMYPDFHVGLKTGTLDNFPTYESFYTAVLKQVDHLLDLSCSKVKKLRDASCINTPRPVKSLLTKGCLETGRDFNDGGALYDYYQIMLSGIPNLADSLAAIKHFVYDEKRYTLAELKDILEKDFPDEDVRLDFIHKAPKFGNDNDEVDSIAVDITDKSCDTLERLSEKYGISFHAQPFSYFWMVDMGDRSAASPDGRRKGEIIAYSVSPMQGRDFSGLTALLNSISKFPTKRTPGTTSAIVEIDPKLFNDHNLDILTDILMASGKKGLSNVQFNTIDADTLIDAQQHPEKYNNLAVRVSGFSQKFNLLNKPLQNHIIGRTKHTCL